ncbi:MAG: MBOAT family protein [Oscillospiraceae bacterium]|jgi:alginate O-acetyltransferase complex protein AlgI|nr:MBOAT family protein [Oscillospiraceae bacterium]
MVFSSLAFLCVFLPAFLVVYALLPRWRNAVLVLFSLVFYAYGQPIWVLAPLIFSGALSYALGRVMARRPDRRKLALVVSVAVNLGLLAAIKYSGFVVVNLNAAFHLSLAVPTFSLPVGISFYTFQVLSYTIDVYRGKSQPQRSFVAYMSYVTMFPKLVQGPIARYADVETQLARPQIKSAEFSDGVSRFCGGLAKKVLLANSAGLACDTLLGGGKLTAAGAWLGVAFFAFQIYFDFSGYSDMAIGLGKMIGFNFPENFNDPYVARSATDFWRRWHISLSTFFRDYVYIPLGGNRRFQARNIIIVWLLTGLWHGASWNFILWGAYFAVVLLIEKFALLRVLERLPRVIGHLYGVFIILIGWAIFYFTDISRLGAFFSAAFGGAAATDFRATSTLQANALLLPVLVLFSTSLPRIIGKKFAKFYEYPIFSAVRNVVLFALSFIAIVGNTYSPFLYFKF